MSLAEVKPSSLRKYLVEYVVLGLVGAVLTLFYLYLDLNNYIRKDLTRQNIETQAVILKSNEAIAEFLNTQKQKQNAKDY